MANNAIVSRLYNLWTGFLSLWVTDIEKNHPEIAYQNAIASATEKYVKLKAASGRIIARRLEIEERTKEAESELGKTTQQLEAAITTQQDDLAIILITKKNGLTETLAGLKNDLAEAAKDADEAKNALLEMKGEIDRLKAEEQTMIAKLNSAEARIKVQESLSGLSIDAEVKALSAVRDHIKGRVAEAKLGSELRESDLDVRLKELTKSGTALSARAELEAMKKARQAQAAAGSGKTL